MTIFSFSCCYWKEPLAETSTGEMHYDHGVNKCGGKWKKHAFLDELRLGKKSLVVPFSF